MPRYDAQRLEPKWQKFWDENATFRTPNPGESELADGNVTLKNMATGEQKTIARNLVAAKLK